MPDGYDFEGVFYVKSVPEILYSDEHFHICYEIGRAKFEFVMRPQIYTKAYMLAGEAMARWRHHSTDDDNVSPMPRKR